MYNEEQKQRYLEYRQDLFNNDDTCLPVIKNMFKDVEKFERIYHKDCSEFIVPEIMSFYKNRGTYSIYTLLNLNSQFSNYASWAINEHLVKDNQNHYSELNPTDLQSAVNPARIKNQYLTREQVLEICNSANSYRAKVILLGQFEGIKGDSCIELYELTRDDLLGDNHVYIKSRHKKMKVSPQLYSWMEEAVNEMEITFESKEGRKPKVTHFDPSERDKVIKLRTLGSDSVIDEPIKYQRFIFRAAKQAISRYTGTIDTRGLKPSVFYDSGIVDFILRRAKQKYMRPMDYFDSPQMIAEVKEKYGKRVVRTLFLTKYGDYLK